MYLLIFFREMDLPYRGFALDATSQLCEEAGG